MLTKRQEILLGKLIAFCGFSITVFIYNGFGYDPVNFPKMFLLVMLSGVIFGIWIGNVKKIYKSQHRNELRLSIFFLLGLVISTWMSKSNFEISFFGTSGRNTGALTYLSLLLVFMACFSLSDFKNYERIIYAVLFAGFINVFYCSFILISGRDPFPWKNPYNTFLGTLGNPDFISAFLGMIFSISLPIIFLSNIDKVKKVLLSTTLIVELYLIIETNALQGIVVSAIGFSAYLFLVIRAKFTKSIQNLYLCVVFLVSALAVLGMLQIGPLTNFIYKTSVTLRGEYWHAGINMFRSSPIWGIGLDSYGDFYRMFRRPSSIVLPGVNVTTDTAHNVLIDILAGGGILLFVSYLALNFYGGWQVFKYIKARKALDPVFISLFLGWITYTAQSIISINQIGLAIWGWIFLGLLIGYTKNNIERTKSSSSYNKNSKQEELTPGHFMVSFLSTIIAFLLVIPIARSEIAWKHSLRHDPAEQIVDKTNAWPRNHQRFSQTINLLLKSNMPKEALQLARLNARFDPNSYNPWFYIYNITNNESEKSKAKSMLKYIDPLNPTYNK